MAPKRLEVYVQTEAKLSEGMHLVIGKIEQSSYSSEYQKGQKNSAKTITNVFASISCDKH